MQSVTARVMTMVSVVGSFVPAHAFAADTIELANPTNFDSLTALLVGIVNVVTIIAVPIIVFFIILAGFKYVTASGNPSKLQEAHQAILYALIGGVIILGANALIVIVENTVNEFRTIE